MEDSNKKGKCNCGKETFRTVKFGESSMYICNKCTEELANYLMELANADMCEHDSERVN
ncbi:hypothetical protein V7183_10160 [Bacillus sp. JJ1127]|uniref:hypothetical protein n=1 Tax=Bacillus sp. JJ1127 TaxID=3122952 RepID=UPI003000DC07